MVPKEFQAIVLAGGRGTRMPDVLGGTPKCLLPVGPHPMIWYSLNTLQQHGFQEVIVVVLENEKSEIQQALERTPLKLKLDYAMIPHDSDFGTADSIRFIHNKIKSDFILLSCDVVTNVSLFPLINKFRQHDATLTALLFKSGFESDVTVPGPKTKHKPERDLIGIHPDTQRLLFLASTSDFEEMMCLNAHLLRRNGKMSVYSRLVDSHIYVMKRWVVDAIIKKEKYSTLKGEFLPYLIKKQMSRAGGPAGNMGDIHSELGLNTKPDDIYQFNPQTPHDELTLRASLYNDSRLSEPYNGDLIRCYAIEAPKDCIGIRVNTTLSFFAINQKLPQIWPVLWNQQQTISLISPNAQINSTQTKDIAVADSAKLSEKTSLNFSVFGYNCTIAPKNIINSSIIMSNAVVEEGCNIDKCIVGHKAVVMKGSVLKNCLIGPHFVVEEGSKKEMQHLTNADGFMEIDM